MIPKIPQLRTIPNRRHINQNGYKLALCILLLHLTANVGANERDDSTNLDHSKDYGELRLTKEYDLRQGALRGFVVEPSRHYQLQNVEIFLGIPYAAPPVGKLRFMPPGSALPWSGLKVATKFAPVCPQRFPDIKKTDPPSPGRLEYLKRIAPFLHNQSEDCLNLNIYAPSRQERSKKFPVLVFIHGESFEWGSGNPYDGRVLASYGNVMVITLNFRLGVFGFLKPSTTENLYGNNGLLDLLAALQWIKDNIVDLNGDPNSVTLMGHGTGAACVNYLMMSPITNGLFHRAILMSGTALSDWALTKHPLQFTYHVAQSLNCSVTGKDLMDCLQSKPLEAVKNVQVLSRKYETALGASVAGPFIPFEPHKLIDAFANQLSKYNLLIGMTEWESYHEFNTIALQHGLLDIERENHLRNYSDVIFGAAGEDAAKKILAMYLQTSSKDAQRWNEWQNQYNRDIVLDILNDARTAAPLIMMTKKHSMLNRHTYLYIFGHNSEATEFAALKKGVHGQDLPYVFGIPLGATDSHFHRDYSKHEKLLSEVIMRFWISFVKTGSPNNQELEHFKTLRPQDWKPFQIDWPEYNQQHQSYLKLNIPPSSGSFYRQNFTRFWNEDLPGFIQEITQRSVSHPMIHSAPAPKTAHPKTFKSVILKLPPVSDDDETKDARVHFESYGKPRFNQPMQPPKSKPEDMYREIKSIKSANGRQPPPSILLPKDYKHDIGSNNVSPSIVKPTPKSDETSIGSSQTLLNVIITVICLFVLANIALFTKLILRRRTLRTAKGNIPRNTSIHSLEHHSVVENDYCSANKLNSKLFAGGSVLKIFKFKPKQNSIIKRQQDKNFCKTPISDDSGGFGRRQRFNLRRHLSTSTIDAQTKVKDWISKGYLDKRADNPTCSSIKLTKSEELLSHNKRTNQLNNEPAKILQQKCKSKTSEKSTSTHGSTFSMNSKDISDSIKHIDKPYLNQQTAAKDSKPSLNDQKLVESILLNSTDCTDSPLKQMNKSFSKNVDTQSQQSNNSTFFINISDIIPDKTDSKTSTLNVSHKHSVSDPIVDINYEEMSFDITTLNQDVKSCSPVDLNVTCRDESVVVLPLTPAEALLSIKKRNYPKVLPDYPRPRYIEKRHSLQPCTLQSFKSVPKQFLTDEELGLRNPPDPPPRTTSTLDRKITHRTGNLFKTELKANTSCDNVVHTFSLDTNTKTITPSGSDEIDGPIYSQIIKTKPRVIISAGSGKNQESDILVSTPVLKSPSHEIKAGARVLLRDSFYSLDDSYQSSLTSVSEKSNSLPDDDLNDDYIDHKLIAELVGLDYRTEDGNADSYYQSSPEMVKISTFSPTKNYENITEYCGVDDEIEKTARIKQKVSLNKYQSKSESFEDPPEKIYKLKDLKKPSILPKNILLKNSSKIIGKPGKVVKSKSTDSKISSDNCGSDSSNDTETSTGTVKANVCSGKSDVHV